jgi:hypothetical protein
MFWIAAWFLAGLLIGQGLLIGALFMSQKSQNNHPPEYFVPPPPIEAPRTPPPIEAPRTRKRVAAH